MKKDQIVGFRFCNDSYHQKRLRLTARLITLFLSMFSIEGYSEGHINVFEDLLYWHASQQSTSPWAYIQTSNSPPGARYTEPNVYFGWHAGLKLGIQYEIPESMDTKLYWTHFSTSTREAYTAKPNEFILPEFFNGFTTELPYNDANLHWQIELNMIDAEVGHQFNPSDSLSVRPFIGVKGGTINQTIHSSWRQNFLNTTLYSAQENLKNNFYGVGPSFGIDTIWGLSKHLSLRGDVSTALLWGHWNIQDIYDRPEALSGLISRKVITSNTNNLMLGAFTARSFMGLEWRIEGRALVTIKAGYEMQFWSNQLRLPVFQALPVHGDLTLQGATCGILIKL